MKLYEDETLRYFANIVGRYSMPTQKAIAKVRALDLKIICPAHGPILRSDPMHIVDLYDKWSKQETDEGIVVVYGSMYGNTKLMTDAIARAACEARTFPASSATYGSTAASCSAAAPITRSSTRPSRRSAARSRTK